MISGVAKIDDSTGAVAAASVRELPATTPTTMPSVQAMTIAATISPTVVANAARNTPPSVAAAAAIALGAARMIWLTRPERTTASHAARETAVISNTLPARDRVMPRPPRSAVGWAKAPCTHLQLAPIAGGAVPTAKGSVGTALRRL